METLTLNDILDQMDLIDIYRTFHPNAEDTFFTIAHGSFSRIDLMLGHKISLNKAKKIQVISSIFWTHGMKLEIKYKKKTRKITNMWRLNNQWVSKEMRGEIKKYLERNANGIQPTKMYGL